MTKHFLYKLHDLVGKIIFVNACYILTLKAFRRHVFEDKFWAVLKLPHFELKIRRFWREAVFLLEPAIAGIPSRPG